MKKRKKKDKLADIERIVSTSRATKINIAIFLLTTLLSIVFLTLKSKSELSWNLLLIILLFNTCAGLLVILSINKIVKITNRSFPYFIFYLLISIFIYWYSVSAILHFYYGTFLTWGGFYYFLVTRTYTATVIFYIASGFIILSLAFTLYYFSRKYHIIEGEPPKLTNKKLKVFLILLPIAIILAVIIITPKTQATESTPLIETIIYYLKVNDISFKVLDNFTIPQGDKVLDISTNLEKPNFIFILLESIPAEHLTLYGYERNVSPNIDAFAEKSIVFNKSYSVASHSDYAQPTFLSAKYTLTNPYRNFFDQDYPRVFMWDVLKKQNYSTAYISSQDDEWADMIKYYNKENLDLYDYSLSDGIYDYGTGNARKDYDEKTIEKVIDWINNSDKPFFIYTNLQATHYPYVYPENNSIFTPDNPSSTSYFSIADGDYEKELNRYDNSIFYVDKQVGKLLDYLEENDLYKNTIIVLSADHGEILERRHGYLRHGFGVYEEEVRTPLMIYIPEQEPRIINNRVQSIDLIPTLVDITGFEQLEDFQGYPMTKKQTLYFVAQNQNFKIGLLRNNIKFMLDAFNNIEVYNLTEDPLEQNNLAKTPKDEVKYFEYGYLLNKWYKCQTDFYEKEKWKKGEIIHCGREPEGELGTLGIIWGRLTSWVVR